MNETAAWLVDRVTCADLGWRQYVLTFPPALAVGLCFRSGLANAIIRLCLRVLFEHQRARATAGPGIPRPGAIVWPQRFSDGAGAWLHLHILAPEGVFREQLDSLDVPFQPQPPPTQPEVAALADTLHRRVTRLLRRSKHVPADDPLLETCARQPATPIRQPTPPPTRGGRPTLLADSGGFTVHAATAVAKGDRDGLERLIRYLARPPLPKARLERLIDGRVVVRLKRPRRGITRFLFEPIAFIARLAALVSPPMSNQVRYFGIFATGSLLRPRILPTPPDPTPTRPTAPPRPRKMTHAELLMRCFQVDLLACPCGGRLRLISVVTDPDVVQAFCAAYTLSHQLPARAPPAV